MSQVFGEIRRAPARIIVSVFALALAIGAIGVFAIPTVAASSLRDTAHRDQLAQIVMSTTDTGDVDIPALLTPIENVELAEIQVLTHVAVGNRGTPELSPPIQVVGVEIGQQQIDIVHADKGRLPKRADEVLVSDGVADIGATIAAVGHGDTTTELTVVGVGGTSAWSGEDVLFTTLDTAAGMAGLEGANRVVVVTHETDQADLSATAEATADLFSDQGIALTLLPEIVPNGEHPIETDIEEVSTLIGLLGIVAGIVAIVLLGSTTNTLITERTREAAVMRMLGARRRKLRRRLRRLAVGIAVAAAVIGVPLGILISNVIARMVLQEFVGITPGLAVSLPVVVGSVAFAVVGARLVASRAARRVTNVPLASALRDRDGSPFGRRFGERLAAGIPIGSLLNRTSIRNVVHRRSRSLAIVGQVTIAVSSLMIVASFATTINDFNVSELEAWNWQSKTTVAGEGLDIDAELADTDPRSEAGIDVIGELGEWEIEVHGLPADTLMINRTLDEGVWIEQPNDAVVSRGFAERLDISVGDDIEVLLASGPAIYQVTGLHPDPLRSVFVGVETLSTELGASGRRNVIYSLDHETSVELAGLTEVVHYDAVSEDETARRAIMLIFGAIGFVVVAVTGLAIASGLAVNVYERRHEFAALEAIGGRRRDIYRVVSAELAPLAMLGIGLGLAFGYIGSWAIVDSFEASDAVEINLAFATGAIPAVVAVVVLGSLAIAGLMVRRVTSQPVAETLRTAA